LLWSVGTSGLVNNFRFIKISAKTTKKVLTPIIRLNNFDVGVKLCLNHFVKRLENREHLTFSFQQIDPCGLRKIINKRNKLTIISYRNNPRRALNINMNNNKSFITFIKTQRKRQPMVFGKFTSFTFKLKNILMQKGRRKHAL
jgi:hypothetical protein